LGSNPYPEKYFDLTVQHFHKKLRAEHGIELSYSWVKQALQGAGLVARGRKPGAAGAAVARDAVAYRRRPDQWFQDERWFDHRLWL